MELSERPILRLPLTITDKILELLGILLLLGFWFFTLYHYNGLPETIPTHFGAGGVPDGYGPKWTILSLPLVASVLYIGLTILVRYPHKMNYTATITATNAAKQYTIMTRMMRVMKVAICLVFFLIDYQTVQLASGLPDVLGKWFLLILISLIFVPLFYFLIQSSKNA